MCQAARDWTSLAPGKRGSRPMADKRPDLLRARSWQDLPPRIYVALVGLLFGTPAFINLLEVLPIATIGGMASLRSGDPLLAGLTLATCAAVPTVDRQNTRP